MAIESNELKNLMQKFLDDVVDLDSQDDFKFCFNSLLTYVVEKENGIKDIDNRIEELTNYRNNIIDTIQFKI